MRDLYSRTTPVTVRKWTDQTDTQRREPIRTLAIVTSGDYDRPIGPVDTNCHVQEMGTFAPGPRLNLKPRRERGLIGRLAKLMRINQR